MKDKQYIQRNYVADFVADEQTPGLIRGVPIVKEVFTDIGGAFREIIRSSAINPNVLKKEIKLFENHNIHGSKAMASSLIPIEKLGGMTFTQDESGITMEANLNLKRTDSNDLYLAIQDRSMTGMSFMFSVKRDTWDFTDPDYPTRYIEEIDDIIEVSVVNFPAYPQTSIGVRSIESSENDLNVLDKARHQNIINRSAETEQLELLKFKNKNILIGGRK